jgi:hypothetical protein
MKTLLDSTSYACTVLVISMLGHCNQTLQGKSHLCTSLPGNCVASVPISKFKCLWAIYIFPGSVHIFPCSRISRPILEKYINHSQIYECRDWETEHYYSVLEITLTFLGIHKWEPDIYIGFSPALHLQWRDKVMSREKQPTIDDNKCLQLFYELFIPGRREGGRAGAIWLHKDTRWSEFFNRGISSCHTGHIFFFSMTQECITQGWYNRMPSLLILYTTVLNLASHTTLYF